MDAASRSWLAVELAQSEAASNNSRGFQIGIADAYQHLGGPDGVEIGGRFLGAWHAGVIERAHGRGLLVLGNPRDAYAVLERAIAHCRGHGRLLGRIYLAQACVVIGEPEEACRLLSKAYTAAAANGYGLALGLISQARARIPNEMSTLPCMQQLDERLGLIGGQHPV